MGKPSSLLAKWMPSINTSSAKSRALARKFVNVLGMDERTYRKTLAKLRASSHIIESMISSNKWDAVDYEHVPSQANLKYKNAFLKHDYDRRLEFLNKLTNGEAKINASTVFPHDIFSKYSDKNYYLNQRVGMFIANEEIINNKYLFYVLDNSIPNLYNLVSGSSVKNLSSNVLNDFEIPLPPLEVQCEIVRILDNFTLLSAELSAELSARQKKYEYY